MKIYKIFELFSTKTFSRFFQIINKQGSAKGGAYGFTPLKDEINSSL
jgi:hypothetical protein